eukprot:TRINITY_DN28794_c0_g1_i1.p1 TRINITY_DN28794_c0_g1~~TRINITY_DN28794_c0_g1_i1.p1  ORF type:complete len:580 (+),score=113.85 TRINITY_DN28794_c0_g1_i1:73-1740(+)
MATDGEPRSLSRLRESLANLEGLERQCRHLRERYDGGACEDLGARLPISPRHRPQSPSAVGAGSGLHLGLASRGARGSGGGCVTEPPDFGCHGAGSSSPSGGGAWARSSVAPRSHQRGSSMAVRSLSPSHFTQRVARAADEYSSRFRAAADEYSSVAAQRDAALAYALEKAQERIELLRKERDEAVVQREQACARAANLEARINRLSVSEERAEAERKTFVEEQQRGLEDRRRDAAELHRTQLELKESQEQRQALEVETERLRGDVQRAAAVSGEWRERCERLLQEQRERRDVTSSFEAASVRDQARRLEISEALFSCLQERSGLLHFLVELLTSLQSLFYDPTPFTQLGIFQQASGLRFGGGRGGVRCSSAEPCGGRLGAGGGRRIASPGRLTATRGGVGVHCRQDARTGASDLRELMASLEAEIGQSSAELSRIVELVSGEAERCRRFVDVRVGLSNGGDHGHDNLGDQAVLRTCADWCSEERRLRELRGGPSDSHVARVDWNEAKHEVQSITRSMENKFNQLLKVRRALQARPISASCGAGASRRGGCGRCC